MGQSTRSQPRENCVVCGSCRVRHPFQCMWEHTTTTGHHWSHRRVAKKNICLSPPLSHRLILETMQAIVGVALHEKVHNFALLRSSCAVARSSITMREPLRWSYFSPHIACSLAGEELSALTHAMVLNRSFSLALMPCPAFLSSSAAEDPGNLFQI